MSERKAMTDQELESLAKKFRARQCPGCKATLGTFSACATPLLIEQSAMNELRDLNKSAGWSVRTSGEAYLAELQFISFMSVCPNCSLISNWDFEVDELEAVLLAGAKVGISIKWNHNPELIKYLVEKAPENRKNAFRATLDLVSPIQEADRGTGSSE